MMHDTSAQPLNIIDAAWERYRALAIAISCDPALAADRQHMEALARAERHWKSAFLASEA